MEAVKNCGQRDLKTSSITDCDIILCDDGFQICKVIYMWFVSSNQGQKDFFSDRSLSINYIIIVSIKNNRFLVDWLGGHDFCLSQSHYTDPDPTSSERCPLIS